MSDFPTHWGVSTFGEVSEYVQRGKGPKYCEHSAFPVVNQKAIRWHGIEEQHLKFVAQEQWSAWSEERFIKKGDILWNSTGTGTVGRACHLDEIQAQKAKVVDSHVTIVRLSQDIDSKFGYYWIRSPEIQAKIDSLSNGSTNQVELSRNIVLETKFPVPPRAEQTRIAQKLDELLAQVDTLKPRIDAIPALLKRFRQSVLAAAISGRLTEEWRMQSTTLLERTDFEPFPKIFELYAEDYIEPPTHWQLNALGNMAGFQQGLQIAKSERRTEPGPDVLPILRTVNYESNFKEDVHYAIVSDKSIIAEPEDIILSRTGTVGRVLTGYKGVMHNNSFRINYKREIFIREYLIIFLESPLCQGYIKKKAGKSSQPDLTHKEFSKCPVLLPQLVEQAEIVRRVEQLFAFADQLEAKVATAQTRIDRLTQSILAKAFRGELVPQDPNDEPASLLLERIQAQRAAAPKAKRGRKSA